MKISIIIVNYNTDKLILDAIDSIFKFVKNLPFEVIVVDNGSDKNNLKDSLSKYKQVFYYYLEENIGFGRANNFGYDKSSGDFIFLLNSDAYLIELDSLVKMKNYLESNDDVGITGANLLTPNLKANTSYGNFLSVKKILHDFGIKKSSKSYYQSKLISFKVCDVTKPTAVDYVSGAAMMIKKSVILKLGLFNPKYFMYFEDQDLCFRFLKNGYKTVILPEVKIIHIGGRSVVKSSNENPKLQYQVSYSKYLFLNNVTNKFMALFLYNYGKLYRVFNKVMKKLKT